MCPYRGRYWYLFKRLTAVSAHRFYRFEHIVSYGSDKVVAKSAGQQRRKLECYYYQPFQGFFSWKKCPPYLTSEGQQFFRLYQVLSLEDSDRTAQRRTFRQSPMIPQFARPAFIKPPFAKAWLWRRGPEALG